jgi:hypothetical protein
MLYFFEQLGILKISTEVTDKMNGTEKYDAVFDKYFYMFKSLHVQKSCAKMVVYGWYCSRKNDVYTKEREWEREYS